MKRILWIIALFLICNSSFSQSPYERVQTAIEAFMAAEDPEDALSILKSVSSYTKNIPDSTKANYYLSIGIAFGQMGNIDSSFHYLDRVEAITSSQQIEFLTIKVYNTRGLVYMGSGSYEKALEAFQQARGLAEGNNSKKYLEALSDNYGNSGGVFYQLGQLDKAIEVSKKALAISKQLENPLGMAYNHLRLAIVYRILIALTKGFFT